jgi:7-cyano-7-deazaguanine synthase in queuosine biosynthesis
VNPLSPGDLEFEHIGTMLCTEHLLICDVEYLAPRFAGSMQGKISLAPEIEIRPGVEADDSHKLQIHAPLIDLHKHEIIARGLSLGVDYADTTSCYDPREHEGVALACGRCESCSLRREGFVRASTKDPTRYV